MKFSVKLLQRLKSAYSVTVLTGAGMSAASGVPTFRGENGLWKKFRPEELASYQAFSNNPDLVWEWYQWRRDLIKKVKPNLGHYALVDLQRIIPEFNIVTQNVDNLHQAAGNKKVLELHGNITKNRCAKCATPYVGEFSLDAGIPKCANCGGFIRPAVVWFGEMLDTEKINQAQEFAAEAEIIFSVGTSGLVEPAASLPYIAKGNGAYVVEINTEVTPLTENCDESIRGGADVILPELFMHLQKLK